MRPRPRLDVCKSRITPCCNAWRAPKGHWVRRWSACKTSASCASKSRRTPRKKKKARTKELLANMRVAKRQDCDSYEARITDLETQITAKERQHAQDMKGMAVKVDEAHANAAKGQSSLQKARERADVWKAKALEAEARKMEAEARKVEAENRWQGFQAEVANLREIGDLRC